MAKGYFFAKSIKRLIKSFTDLYKRVVLWDDLDNDTRKKIFLSDKEYTEELRRCRFCGKSEEETLFDDSSHAISEMIGSKWLFSHYECRECNKAFGNNCEDSQHNGEIIKATSYMHFDSSGISIIDFPQFVGY